MTYDEVLSHFKTQVGIAAALGITQGSVSAWGGVVPDRWQPQLELITNGALRAAPHLRQPANLRVDPDASRGSTAS